MSEKKIRKGFEPYNPYQPPEGRARFEVKLHIETLSAAINRRRGALFQSKIVLFPCKGKWIKLTSVTVNQTFRILMRDVGQGMARRISDNVGLKLEAKEGEKPIILADEIKIVDGLPRFPDPANRMDMNLDVLSFVKEYRSIFEQRIFRFLKSDDATTPVKIPVTTLEKIPDNKSLLLCFDHLLQRCTVQDRLPLFQTLTCHFWFGPPYTKLSLLEHSYRHLKKIPGGLDDYKQFRSGRAEKYDIPKAIAGNPVLESVYDFYDAHNGTKIQYEDNAIGVLLFMINSSKHSDQHCKYLQMDCWTDEEKVAFLEHCFPGEFHYLFFFLWSCRYDIDWNQILRDPVHPKVRTKG